MPAPRENVPENRRDDADGDDVAHLRGRAEPLRAGEHLDDGRPRERAAEEARRLEGVDRIVPERGLPEVRQVPEEQVHRPDGQRNEGVGEEAQGSNRSHGQKRASQPLIVEHTNRNALLLTMGHTSLIQVQRPLD